MRLVSRKDKDALWNNRGWFFRIALLVLILYIVVYAYSLLVLGLGLTQDKFSMGLQLLSSSWES